MIDYETSPQPAPPENPIAVPIDSSQQANLAGYFEAAARRHGDERPVRCAPAVLEFGRGQDSTAHAVANLMGGVAQRNGVNIQANVATRLEPGEDQTAIPFIALTTQDFRLTGQEIANQGGAMVQAANSDLAALGSPLRLPSV